MAQESLQTCYVCLKQILPNVPRVESVPGCCDYRHKAAYHPACVVGVASCLYCRDDVVRRGDMGVCILLEEHARAHQKDAGHMYRSVEGPRYGEGNRSWYEKAESR
jgi:hypothetical protein